MENVISLTQILKVKPDKAINFLVMPLGTRVEKGDLLAEKKSFLGRKIEVRSPVKGILTSLSSNTGGLVIKTETREEKSDKAEESLKVTTLRIEKKQKTQKDTQALKKSLTNSVFGVFGFGTGTGELTIGPECLQFTHLNKDFEGKVIFASSIAGSASVFKASALGVSALVIGFIDDLEEIGQEISGRANLGFLVLASLKDEKLIEKIKGWKGKKVRVDGEKMELHLLEKKSKP